MKEHKGFKKFRKKYDIDRRKHGLLNFNFTIQTLEKAWMHGYNYNKKKHDKEE